MQKMIHDYPIDVNEFDKIEREGKELLLITFEDLKTTTCSDAQPGCSTHRKLSGSEAKHIDLLEMDAQRSSWIKA